MDDIKKIAIIVAAGSGSRMGGPMPKQFQNLDDIPLAVHPGLRFREFDPNIELVYVIGSGTAQIWESLLKMHFPTGGWRLCMGGKSRFESVRNGIRSIQDENTLVAIHDGARPFISAQLLQLGFLKAFEKGNAVFSVPVKESIRLQKEGGASLALDRTHYHIVQTPQIFWQKDLKNVYQQEDDPRFTDDATVMELAGHSIHLVEGNFQNIKVTTPEDWWVAQQILDRMKEEENRNAHTDK
jgi:2-C-methyl-D-erythritol 4-phosphate cytidylyltransferase